MTSSVRVNNVSFDTKSFPDLMLEKLQRVETKSFMPSEEWNETSQAIHSALATFANQPLTDETYVHLKEHIHNLILQDPRCDLLPIYLEASPRIMEIYDQSFEEAQTKQILAHLEIRGTREFQNKIKEDIAKIGRARIGRELFARIIRSGKKVIIEEGEANEFLHHLQKITLSQQPTVVQVAGEEGKTKWARLPDYIVLAHEMIHFMHFAEEDIPDPNAPATKGFTNLEEEYTITGRGPNGLNTVSENAMEVELGLPVRMSHVGSIFPPEHPNNLYMDVDGWMRSHEVATLGMLDELARYITLGMDIDEPTKPDGQTCLHLAVKEGQYDIALYLLQNGARVDIQDRNDETALHLAVQKRDKRMIRLLLQHEANPKRVNRDECTPVDLIKGTEGEEEILALFQSSP